MSEIAYSESEKLYRAERDFNSLTEACEILEDIERMEGVQEYAKKAKENFTKVLDKEYLKKIMGNTK